MPVSDKITQRAMLEAWKEACPSTQWDGQEWWRYTDNHWSIVPEGQIKTEFYRVVIGINDRATSNTVNSVLESGKQSLYINPNTFDSDPDLLPCANGVVMLKTKKLFPHAPHQYNTSILPYDYDPLAPADSWHYYLKTSAKPDTQKLLQEFAGYSTTTDTRLETALWLYGPRGSGKSTFIEGLRTMLGKRAGDVGLSDLNNRFALADVPGKTLLVATEMPSTTIATSLLNRLISGEPIPIEQKFQKRISVIPRAKLLWAMNDLPTVTSANDGLFRRIHIIEFGKRAVGEVQTDLKDKIALEGAGILNWALAGLDRLRKRAKFDPPASVISATSDYQELSDIASAFLADRYTRNAEGRIRSMDLYAHYMQWRRDHGIFTKCSLVQAAGDWQRLNLLNVKSDGVMWWAGISPT